MLPFKVTAVDVFCILQCCLWRTANIRLAVIDERNINWRENKVYQMRTSKMSSGPNTITITQQLQIRVRSNNTKRFESEMSDSSLNDQQPY